MSTTLDGVREEILRVKEAVVAAENGLIDLLEAEKRDKALIGTAEATIAALTKELDDLQGTKDYIIQNERRKSQLAQQPVMAVMFMSQWIDGLTPQHVTTLVQDWNAANERCGITGVLLSVACAWFAGSLEGPQDHLERLLRHLRHDKRHTNFTVLRQGNVLQRVHPDHGLRLRFVDDAGTSIQSFFVCTMARQLSGAAPYRPPHTTAPDVKTQCLVTVTPYAGAYGARIPSASGGEKSSATSSSSSPQLLHELPSVDQIEVVEAVHAHITAAVNAARMKISRDGTLSLIAPHGQSLHIVATTVNGGLAFAKRLYADFYDNAQPPPPLLDGHISISAYRPLIVVHVGELQVVMDGAITAVGPPFRYNRRATVLCQQHGFPLILSDAAADALNRQDVVSLGTYDVVGCPDEVFTLPHIKGKHAMPTPPAEATEAAAKAAAEEAVAAEMTPEQLNKIRVSKALSERRKKKVFQEEEDAIQRPKGLASEGDLREAFEALCEEGATTVTRKAFTLYYFQTLQEDPMGIVGGGDRDVDALIRRHAPGGNTDTIDFDLFAMLYYRASRW